MLYLWYEYVKEMGIEPRTYHQLFMFPAYMKTRGIIRAIEIEYAKATKE